MGQGDCGNERMWDRGTVAMSLCGQGDCGNEHMWDGGQWQ